MMKLKDALAEVAPPGFEKAVKAMKKDKSVDNPHAVAWSMKNKGAKPSDEIDEMDASQPNAPSSLAGMDEICEECGMSEGHASGCSMISESDDEGDKCPECDGPSGKHDRGCPLNPDNDMDEASKLDDEEDMDTLGDDVDSEACPGCGSKPGDGINPKCEDPMGCGYWKEFKADAEGPLGRSLRDMLKDPPSGEDTDDVEGFDLPTGEFIENPFWDVTGREEVDPDEYYGDAFRNSTLAKRLRWGESSDFDGLPLTEACMFDRFDTLVGHRSDGTFDDRAGDASRLRSLVKKVVREAWSTYDPKTGEETEHSVDDDELKDLFDDKDEKHEARGCVREGDIDEMKLSVAGPAFGAASSDTDDQDDEDEDYKVLTPHKAPEPEQSGTRAKSKKKKS